MEIFKLFGSILINTDEADKSLSKTDKNAKSFASSLGSGIKTAAKWGAAVVGAAGTAAAGMYKMATGAASSADDIDKMSQKIGVSREAYQELSFALSQSGTDVSKLQTGLKTLSTQAEKGNAIFDQLGISLNNIDGSAKSQEQLFYDVTNALQGMEEGTEKTTIATTLLGKAGTELMPLFNGAAGSLDEMRKQAHDLGLVLDDELIDSGVSLTDTLDQLKRAAGSVMTQLGAKLMPVVEKASKFIISNIPKINKLIDQISPIVERSFDEIVPVILDLADELLPQIINVVTALLPPISQIFSQLAPIISQLVGKLAPILVKLVEKLLPPIVEILDSLMPILDIAFALLDPILDLVLALLDPLADILGLVSPILKLATDLINIVLKPIMPLIQAVADILGNVLGEAISGVTGYVAGALEMFEGFMTFLSGDFDKGIQLAADGFMNAFSSALGFVDSLFGTNLQQWYTEVTAFWRDAGAKLYEIFHAEEIAESADSIRIAEMRRDIIQTSNEYMREGMSAADALAKAKNEILTTTESLAMFNANLAGEITDEEARQRQETLRATGQIYGFNFNASDYYSSHFRTPHLASGGVVYGKTLAVVGDNRDAKSNPEVIAPLSELKEIIAGSEMLSELKAMNALLQQIARGQPVSVNVDGQRVASVITDKINAMRYNRGTEVVFA